MQAELTIPKRKRSVPRRLLRFWGKYKFFHLLVLPGLLFYVIFEYMPILLGLVISVKDYNGLGGFAGIFEAPLAGFRHYSSLFQSEYFWRLLKNTLIISGYRLIFDFPAPIILALLLNELKNQIFKRTVQTITYLPHFISWVIVAGLCSMLLSTTQGPINAVIEWLGFKKIGFLSDTRYFRGVLVVSSIWKGLGWGTIVYLAAISAIPTEQYEAAVIEGASRFQRAIYVTIPSISFAIIIFFILRVGKIINENFEQIFNLYNPAVYSVSDVFETYVYRRGILQADYSYATAVGFFKSTVSLVLIFATNKIAKLLGQEGLW